MKKIFWAVILFIVAIPVVASAQVKNASNDTAVYIIDTTNSYLSWSCDTHYGVVPLKSGYLKLINGIPVDGDFVILMDSLKDQDIDYKLMRETLHNTLKSKFFFDVSNYPTVDFQLDYAEQTGKDTYKISGNLKIKGVVNCIHFNSVIHVDGKKISISSDKFSIDRTQYGITIYSKKEADDDNSVIVSDEIYFVVHLNGVRK